MGGSERRWRVEELEGDEEEIEIGAASSLLQLWSFRANAPSKLSVAVAGTQPREETLRSTPYDIALTTSSDSSMDDLSNSSSASYANSWISWFLASKGNEYFCEVDDEYIVDRFNLTGLNSEVAGYSAALELITDTSGDDGLNEEQRDLLETSARHLYGLIHARFIITSRGLAKMIEKYKKGDFGRCPRVLCYSQALLPLGLADVSQQKAVKLYCPRCEDLYSPKSSRHATIDGAYFGSTFSHMLFMVYPGMTPTKSSASIAGGNSGAVGSSLVGGVSGLGSNAAAKVERTRPRIFGFMVHEAARLIRWQDRVKEQQIARLEKIERDGALD